MSIHSISPDDYIACTTTINRFSMLVDAGQYEEASLMFSSDGGLQRPNERIEGRAALLESLQARPVHRLTRHVLSNTTLSFVRTGVIQAHSYVSVYRHLGASGSAIHLPVAAKAPETLAEYQDELRWTDGAWRLWQRNVVPIFDSSPR